MLKVIQSLLSAVLLISSHQSNAEDCLNLEISTSFDGYFDYKVCREEILASFANNQHSEHNFPNLQTLDVPIPTITLIREKLKAFMDSPQEKDQRGFDGAVWCVSNKVDERCVWSPNKNYGVIQKELYETGVVLWQLAGYQLPNIRTYRRHGEIVYWPY